MKKLKTSTRVLAMSVLTFTMAYFVNGCSDSGSVPNPLVTSTSGGTIASEPVAASGDATALETLFAQGPGDGRRGPPPEALAACEDQAVDTSCSFTGRHGNNVEGTCGSRPEFSDQVACIPNDRPERGNRRNGDGPPEEVFAACEGLLESDECTVEAPFGSVAGTCEVGRNGERLLCRPDDWPER